MVGYAALLLLTGCADSVPALRIQEIPEPPQQHAAWSPPASSIPTNLLSAAESLFDLGFPDPRGCDYRHIEVIVNSVWDGLPEVAATRGWVLPENPDESQRYAIAWNGLIYAVKAIGEAADLKADATALVPPSGQRLYNGLGEIRSIYPTNSASSRVLLLLRCGEVEAALTNWIPDERVMVRVQAGLKQPHAQIGRREHYDPFLEFAEDWAWAQFDRVLSAHMRGDVELALAAARQLAATQPGIEAEAARRGFARPPDADSKEHEKPRPYLYSLDQLPQLLADLERRARKPMDRTVVEAGLTNISSRSERVAALIEDLDRVQARQMSQPGWVTMEMDPIVQALIAEGDAAVEPLIQCLESDTRLTRSVGFHRDFMRRREIIPAADAARAALRQILRVRFRSTEEFRAYWKQNKGLALEDRWYATLKDASAGNDRWLQAARNILQPDNVSGVPGSGHYITKLVEPGQKPAFRGEVLRAKRNPSVTDLLLKRAEQAADEAGNLDQFMGVNALRDGAALVSLLVEWENPAAALSPARSLLRRAIEFFADKTSFIGSSGRDLARIIPRLTQLCVEGGDPNVLAEYAVWISQAEVEKMDTYVLEAFEPLWTNPAHPLIVPLADRLFNDPTSPWSTLPWRRPRFRSPLHSELIKVPAFRTMVARELDNREVAGTVEWLQGDATRGRSDTVLYQLAGRGGGSRGGSWPEVERPADGAKSNIRYCDWIAWELSNAKHIAFFNPFASEKERDNAIEAAKAALISRD